MPCRQTPGSVLFVAQPPRGATCGRCRARRKIELDRVGAECRRLALCVLLRPCSASVAFGGEADVNSEAKRARSSQTTPSRHEPGVERCAPDLINRSACVLVCAVRDALCEFARGNARREFFMLIGGATVAWAVAARAQLTTKMPRIGILPTGRSEPHCEASRLPINPLANELRQSQCFARL